MADKSDDRNLMIEFTAQGQVRPSVRAAEQLGRIGGLWRLVPEVGQIMLLERVGEFDTESARKNKERQVRLSGTFESNTELHNAIGMIGMAQHDGALHVTDGVNHKVLFFRRGVLLSARSSLPEDRLGNVLVRVGMLSIEDRDACLPDIRRGQPLGNVLVSRGIMTTPKVYEGLRKQAEEIFYSLLPWPRGAFYLVAPLDMTEVPAMLHMSTQELLMDGVRRLDEEQHKEPSQPGVGGLHRASPVPAAQLPDDGVMRIVDAYDKALRGLFASLGDEPAANLRSSLNGFIQDSLPFHDLFFGVKVGEDGAFDRRALEDNVNQAKNATTIHNLQLGLSEILFFALFAVGEDASPDVQRQLQRDVAMALRALPKGEDSNKDLQAVRAKPITKEPQSEPAPYDAETDFSGLDDDEEPAAQVEKVPASKKERAASQLDDDAAAEWDEAAENRMGSVVGSFAEPGAGEDTIATIDEVEDGGAEDSVIAAIVDEEFSSGIMTEPIPEIPDDDDDEDSATLVKPMESVANPEVLQPSILLSQEAESDGKPQAVIIGEASESFEIGLDEDEEIISLLDKVTEVQEEEAISQSRVGKLPTKPRPKTPSEGFEHLLENEDDKAPADGSGR